MLLRHVHAGRAGLTANGKFLALNNAKSAFASFRIAIDQPGLKTAPTRGLK
jgi:hypothetical protein